MSLQGFYTTKGLALAAKTAAGTKLTITKVTAGNGETAKSAAALAQEKQTLTAGTASVNGQSAVLPVTLAETDVSAAYELTELGVYAQDPDAGEILYQVFRLDKPISLTTGGEDACRFFLKQTVGAAGITVSCSPAGLLVDEDLASIREKILAQDAPSVTVSVAAADLQAYLDALPRLLTQRLTFVVSGTLTGRLTVQDFYGSGSLAFRAATETGFTVSITDSIGVHVKNCAVDVNLTGVTFTRSASAQGTCTGILYRYTKGGNLLDCIFANGEQGTAIHVECANIQVSACTIKGLGIAIKSVNLGRVLVDITDTQKLSGNTLGAYLNYGGLVLLTTGTPNTLGGASNENNGGVLTRYLTQL